MKAKHEAFRNFWGWPKGWNKYNLYSLSFWPIYHRLSTDSPPTIDVQRIGRVPAAISAECRPLYRPRYLPIVGRYVDHHSADISVDTSVDTSTDTLRSTYRPTLDRYVDRHIGRHSADMSADTSVECRSICRPRCRPICRSRGAQNTHDPKIDRQYVHSGRGNWKSLSCDDLEWHRRKGEWKKCIIEQDTTTIRTNKIVSHKQNRWGWNWKANDCT